MEFSDALQLLLIGISQGCGYALVAIGFVFIYRATEIVNFAHGELMMLGAFMVLTFSQILGLDFWLSVGLDILTLGAFGYAPRLATMSPEALRQTRQLFTDAPSMMYDAMLDWARHANCLLVQADKTKQGVVEFLSRRRVTAA